jgi:glycosyltransferase involved in cell wall biosynthesis
MLTIIIPGKTELFHKRTIEDVLEKATGEIEIIPVYDGHFPLNDELVKDPRVKYLYLEPSQKTQKRHGINQAVEMAKGDYVMALDAHCMMAKGFDEQLIKDHEPNWVQVPRRNRLDAENWCLQTQSDNRPPIDYEYILFNPLAHFDRHGMKCIHGFKWDARTHARAHIMVDDTLTMQASCWFMTKEWYQRMGFMDEKNYTGWGQEAEEISFSTWKAGGALKTNKNTWYAHLHKGAKYGRMYWMSRTENLESYKYSYQHWMVDNKDFMMSLFEKFNKDMLMPGWPKDWKERLWGKQ